MYSFVRGAVEAWAAQYSSRSIMHARVEGSSFGNTGNKTAIMNMKNTE